ncbi:hypothetical protein BD324DRAFT_651609 [Kockovaella imperatae]|uniref:Altered inheritance of mitochondria protein 41 n=1 Tax=Kockovaella imperatae TaxID=4999 RepID=A0A1Y1UE86_9TREE|nr:hypothetical protein BD324DRAFT_651609 [Kockovaella imperatae]ORX36370.1 hypothetical protein BD324DRAFT_651609 [Kockovaella imperatae]
MASLRSSAFLTRCIASSSRSTVLRVSARSLTATRSTFAESGPSGIETALRNGLKQAMKSKDRPAIVVHKAILADITNAAKSTPNPNDPLDEVQVVQTVRKSIAARAVAAEQYAPSAPGAHEENHANLLAEIDVLQSYLPQGPSDEQLKLEVETIIKGLPEDVRSSKSVQGAVMKSLWENLGESSKYADKKQVGKMVSDMLKTL